MRGERVGRIPTLPAGPEDIISVEYPERQPEPGLQLVLPLRKNGRRTGDDDVPDFLTEQQLPCDQAGFDRFSQADVIGDEQVDPGQK